MGKSKNNDDIISTSTILHNFCNIFGYANIAKRNPYKERLYKTTFAIIKVVFIVLVITCHKMNFQDMHIKISDNAVISVTHKLFAIINIFAFYVHIFFNSLKAPKIHRFWQELQALEVELNKIDVKLDRKRLKKIAIIGTAPECLAMCVCILGYPKVFASGRLEEFISHIPPGKLIGFLVTQM